MHRRIFLFFFIIFVLTTAGHIYTIDSYLNYRVTSSLATSHTLSIPPFMMTVEGRDGCHYSKLGVGQSLIALPLYLFGYLIEKTFPDERIFRVYSSSFSFTHKGKTIKAEPQTLISVSDREGACVFFTTLTNAAICAAICTIFFSLLSSAGLGLRMSLVGSAVLGFTTPLWNYSRDFFGEPLITLSLLGLFYYACYSDIHSRRGVVLAGALTSIGILTRLSFTPIAAIVAAVLMLRRVTSRKIVLYILISSVGLLLQAILNYIRFGSPLLTGYHTAFDKGFSTPLSSGLLWNLFSPYRGFFLYVPITLMSVPAFLSFTRKHKFHTIFILATTIYFFLLYSRWWAWHGGWCWGPRFFLPLVPLLLLPGIIRLAGNTSIRWKVAFCGLCICGFVIQLSGILINYTAAYDYWIKIGRLDWSEKAIETLSPIWDHLRAMMHTHPAQYDLWILQVAKIAPHVAISIVVLAVVALWYIKKSVLEAYQS